MRIHVLALAALLLAAHQSRAAPPAIWGCVDPSVVIEFTDAVHDGDRHPDAAPDWNLIRAANAANCVPIQTLSGSVMQIAGATKETAIVEFLMANTAPPLNILWFRYSDFLTAVGGKPFP